MIKKILLGATALVLAASCAMAQELTVSAAASLANAFDEIAAAFEKENPGVKINTNYAASNPLLRQILEGAPVDVFASADQATMDQARDAGALRPDTRQTFAATDLVLIVPKGSPAPAELKDLRNFERIAIGAPESVPAGRYARASLRAAELWDELSPKYVQGANVRQVLDYVARGEADAGFVYRTDALRRGDETEIALVAEGHEPVTYPIAAVAGSRNPELALKFIDFVLSPRGLEILANHGFAKP